MLTRSNWKAPTLLVLAAQTREWTGGAAARKKGISFTGRMIDHALLCLRGGSGTLADLKFSAPRLQQSRPGGKKRQFRAEAKLLSSGANPLKQSCVYSYLPVLIWAVGS